MCIRDSPCTAESSLSAEVFVWDIPVSAADPAGTAEAVPGAPAHPVSAVIASASIIPQAAFK